MQILLANPRGFCAGVDRAIEIVERALESLGAPIYVRHEVVHNRFVVENLRAKGAVFVEEVDEIPDGATTIDVKGRTITQKHAMKVFRTGIVVLLIRVILRCLGVYSKNQ